MFTQEELDLCDALCAAAGPVLVDKEEHDWGVHRIAAHRALQFAGKFTGSGHLGYKAAGAAVLAATLFLIFAKDTFRIHAHAQIQGEVRRVINAPFDGYIRAQHARAGQIVREGGLLAELQDNDLALDRLRHIAQRRQYKLELDRALSRRDLAASNIARSQVEQKDAEIELSELMLERAQLRAPFDSVVVAGDLSQAVGRPVSRGDVLFELAPLDRYRVTLVVPEMEIQSVQVGQTGQVLLTALPEKPFDFVVKSITPVARAVEGVNGFEVLADLKEPDPRLRPAMEGVAKIDAGRRSFVWIWTHELMYWLRVKLWALIP
jgi:multidrug efflux pump subunit AcrA (membrane-fusion protein)